LCTCSILSVTHSHVVTIDFSSDCFLHVVRGFVPTPVSLDFRKSRRAAWSLTRPSARAFSVVDQSRAPLPTAATRMRMTVGPPRPRRLAICTMFATRTFGASDRRRIERDLVPYECCVSSTASLQKGLNGSRCLVPFLFMVSDFIVDRQREQRVAYTHPVQLIGDEYVEAYCGDRVNFLVHNYPTQSKVSERQSGGRTGMFLLQNWCLSSQRANTKCGVHLYLICLRESHQMATSDQTLPCL
jgi:hypothetical protein